MSGASVYKISCTDLGSTRTDPERILSAIPADSVSHELKMKS